MIKTDRLRVDGIDYMGFGIIPKYVMTDIELPIAAKGIYAYFCSYLGQGETVFPKVSTILAELRMSQDRYYKNMRILIEQGYISRQQEIFTAETGEYIFGGNIYTIHNNPKKFENEPAKSKEKTEYHTIQMSGIKSLGYGTIPRAVMADQRLTANAKALYAYYASFVGGGNSAFPERQTIYYHLQIGQRAYYSAYKQLIECNYLVVEQRVINGRKGVNDYILVRNPNESTVNRQKTTVCAKSVYVAQQEKTPCVQNQCTVKPCAQNQCTQEQCTQNQCAYNNNSSNINSLNSNRVNHSFTVEVDQTVERVNKGDQKQERNNQFDWIIGLAHHSEETAAIHHAADLAESTLIEMMKWQSIRKVKDSYINGYKLEEQLRKNCATEAEYHAHVEGVLFRSKEEFVKASETTIIKNPAGYMRSVLWDNANTLRVKYDNDLNSLYMESASAFTQYADAFDLTLERGYYEN